MRSELGTGSEDAVRILPGEAIAGGPGTPGAAPDRRVLDRLLREIALSYRVAGVQSAWVAQVVPVVTLPPATPAAPGVSAGRMTTALWPPTVMSRQ